MIDEGEGSRWLRLSKTWRAGELSVVALAVVVGGCSENAANSASGQPVSAEQRVAGTPRQFSPGAAEPLSIMALSAEVDSDPFGAAVECAAALEITLKSISQLPQAGANEVAALRQAEGVFRARANLLAGDTPAPQAIAVKVQQAQRDPATQVKRAVACLRQGSS